MCKADIAPFLFKYMEVLVVVVVVVIALTGLGASSIWKAEFEDAGYLEMGRTVLCSEQLSHTKYHLPFL